MTASVPLNTIETPQVFFTAADRWREKHGEVPKVPTFVAPVRSKLWARLDWYHPALEVVAAPIDEQTQAEIDRTTASGWVDWIQLPDAYSISEYTELHLKLRDQIADVFDKIDTKVDPEKGQLCPVFTQELQQSRERILDQLRAFDGGQNLMQRMETGMFVTGEETAYFDEIDRRIEINEVGTVRPGMRGAALEPMAAAISQIALREEVALCDSPADYLDGLVTLLEEYGSEETVGEDAP